MNHNHRKFNPRTSLLLPFAGIIIVLLLGITVIAAIVTSVLIMNGVLKIGSVEINISSFILTLLIVNAIIGIVLAALISNIVFSPINKIMTALNRLASGDYSARLYFSGPVGRNKTIKEMTDSFNTMAQELEQTEMLRSDFINNFSHEFKTPIVSIAGFAQLLRRGNLTPEEQTEYLEVIEKESLRLAHMATNVLDLTRIENQNILTDCQKFNVSEQLRTCMLMLEGKWTAKHIEPILPEEEHFLVGNEELMRHVWSNLFDNAIKFSPDYGVVEAVIDETQDRITITVSNFGDLIPEASMDRIFSKFYQADESHASEGNGIGLAIVKKIVDLHDGSIQVTCHAGKTSFAVTLPKE